MSDNFAGQWDVSGPEEGDTVDLTVLICFDGDEVIKLADIGTVRQQRARAEKIATLLNEAEATLE